jgi:serine/threonine protein kinase
MASKLTVLAGPDEGRVFPLGSEVMLLGRSRATETHLTDPHCSRVHCQIIPEGNQYFVVDFDSASGTFVNGKEVERHKLTSGDLVRIGSTHLQYTVEAEETVSAKPPAAKSPSDWAKGLIGQTMAHYEITSPLARGKTGYLFHARDTRTDTPVALKVLHPDFGSVDKKVQHFVEAMKAVLPLSHPHLLKIYGAGKSGDHCWVATEYVPGDSLAAVIGRMGKTGKLDWKPVLRVGIYLARALEYAHSKKLTHQNVTPQNILIGKQPQNTKLTDLMLALATEEDPTKPISSADAPSESLAFMSPERTDGPGAAVDARTDIYSLAATLYAMLAGKAPFSGTTVKDVIASIRYESAPFFDDLQLKTPERLEKIIRRCLAKRPQDRYASAADLRKELESIAEMHSIPL